MTSPTKDEQQPELTRDELGLILLCAWNNVDPKQAPPEWYFHPNDANAEAWKRVADAALDAPKGGVKELRAENAKLRIMLDDCVEEMDCLIRDSDGVYGLHRNGDPASWGELCAGGRFEEWLSAHDKARKALAALTPPSKPPEGDEALLALAELSERALSGDWEVHQDLTTETFEIRRWLDGDVDGDTGRHVVVGGELVAIMADAFGEAENAAFIVAAVNHVRDRLASRLRSGEGG